MLLDEVTSISQIISVFVLVFSVLYMARQLRLLRLTHAENHEWNRRKSAQDISMELNNILADTEVLHKKLNLINRKEVIPLDEINNAINDDPSIQLKINKLLNVYSSVSQGVSNGVYDKKIIATRRDAMIKVYDSLSSYISYRRGKSISTLWSSYETLVNEWKNEITAKKSRNNTGGLDGC